MARTKQVARKSLPAKKTFSAPQKAIAAPPAHTSPPPKSRFPERRLFLGAIRKVLKQVNPSCGITKDCISYIDELLTGLLIRTVDDAIFYLRNDRRRKTLMARHVQNAVMKCYPGEVAKHAISEGTKAVVKTSMSRRQLQLKSGLTFPIGKVTTYLRTCQRQDRSIRRLSKATRVYLTAVMEYIAAEMLELAGNVTRQKRRQRIVQAHVDLAIRHDEELLKLFPIKASKCDESVGNSVASPFPALDRPLPFGRGGLPKTFVKSVFRMNYSVNPSLSLDKQSRFAINEILLDVFDRIASESAVAVYSRGSGTLSSSDVRDTLFKLFPGDCSETIDKEAKTTKVNPKIKSASRNISSSQVKRLLRSSVYTERNQHSVFPYMAAILEHLAEEILKLSGEVCQKEKKRVIGLRHVHMALRHDVELQFLSEPYVPAYATQTPNQDECESKFCF